MGLMMMLTGVLCFISDHVGSQQLSSDHVTSASDKCLGWCLHPKQERSVVNLLKGLEYFFLAPLGYLLTRSLAIYIRSVQNNRMGYPDQMSVAALMAVKGLMVALVIAVLSTHLIGGFILSEGTEFDHMKTLCGGIVLLVLILYFKILETSSRQELPPKPTGHVTPETEERRNKVKQQFQSLGLDSW